MYSSGTPPHVGREIGSLVQSEHVAPAWQVSYTHSGHNPLKPEFWSCCTAAVCQMIQQRALHQKELENPTDTQVERTISRYLTHNYGTLNSSEDLGWYFQLLVASPSVQDEEWQTELKPFPHTQPGHREIKLHLSVYMKMMLCYASVFISMTIFPRISCLENGLIAHYRIFSETHHLFSRKHHRLICLLRYFWCFDSKS